VPLPRNRFNQSHLEIGFTLAPLIAALLLFATTALSPQSVAAGIVGSGQIRPYSIVVLFFSLSMVSVSLDASGLLAFIALRVVQAAGRSGRRLFFAFIAVSSLLTAVTSNDIVIMTLTPIVIYACRHMQLEPMPILFAEFFSANVLSSWLYSGNATNVIVALANNLNFTDYMQYSTLPTLGACITLVVMLSIVFWRKIPAQVDQFPIFDIAGALKSRVSAILSVVLLVSSLAALIASSFTNFPIWMVTLPFGVLTLAKDFAIDWFTPVPTEDDAVARESLVANDQLAHVGNQAQTPELTINDTPSTALLANNDSAEQRAQQASDNVAVAITATPQFRILRRFQHRFPTVYQVLSRQPWALAPFVICMFVMVEALTVHGWTSLLAQTLAPAVGKSVVAGSFVIGLVSALACNVLNNQPATILLVRVLDDAQFREATSPESLRASQFALALASNHSANLTMIGALAGLMWRDILVAKGLPPVTYFGFMRVGVVVTIPVMLVAFGLLAATA
jgi:arsenical pump membrane protein